MLANKAYYSYHLLSTLFTFLLVLLYGNIKADAQIIENPAFERSDIPAFYINKVEVTKDTTFVSCLYYAKAGSWASISKDTYLRDSKNHISYPLLSCKGLPYDPETRNFSHNESCELLFCFSSIAGVEQFDFIESDVERGFNIYGVSLEKTFKKSYTDEELKQISEIASSYSSTRVIDSSPLLKEYSRSLNNLESYNASNGNFPEVIRLGNVELDINEKLYGKEDQNYIEALGRIADVYDALGEYNEAIRLWTEEAAIIKSVYGSDDSKYIHSLENLADCNNIIRNFAEAIRLQKEVTNLKRIKFGDDNFEYAYSLANLATYYSNYGNNKEAIQIGTKATEILRKYLDNGLVVDYTCLSNLAYDYSEVGNFKEASRLESDNAEITKKIKGMYHPEYAISLNRLAYYKSLLLNYDEAMRLCTEAMKIYKSVIGTENPNYSRFLADLADYNSKTGNYSRAIKLCSEALEIYKKVIGTENHNYATSLSNLAGYYLNSGNYAETIRLITEAKDIYERLYGKESLNYAISLNNIAEYNSTVGNYSEAIRLEIEAMELYKKVIGTEKPLYAQSLSNLANYNSRVGNYSEAIRLVTEAMEIYKRVLGTEHPNYAASLNILAINNAEVGNYSEAIRFGKEAMGIYKRIHGTEHPNYAVSLNSLASFYSLVGDYSEAIRLGTEALEIRKRTLGIEHPYYATSLMNLALYNYSVGNYDEAIRLGTVAGETFKKVVGTRHPYYFTSLINLTHFLKDLGNYQEAFECLQHCLEYSQTFNFQNFTELSSRNQDILWTKKYAGVYNILLPNIVNKYQTKQTISNLYDKACLFSRGILLNTGIEIRNLILESGDSVIIDKYNTLSSNIRLYNKLLEKPLKERFMNSDSLYRVIEKQEMALARESKAYGDYTYNLTINWKDVQKRLGKNDIAIEFLDFPIYNTDSTLYVALTLKKNYDSPHMVTLFERKQLEAIPKDIYYTQTDVSNLVWKPLEKELESVRNIYFAPSGELHRIGLEYLAISNTENISDVYKLHRLSSTRQLAFVQGETKGNNTVLYGGINYDEKSNANAIDSASTNVTVLRSLFSYRANIDSLSLRNSFDYLEGTKREADLIAEDMKRHSVPYYYYSGSEGTEESFKKLDGSRPKVMHIATHGFYFTEEEAVKSQLFRPEMDLLNGGGLQARRIVEQKPMTRSGLLFSGCNRTIRHEQIPDEEEDGILTAQEISMLDLRGLDLVVLSACQTGLGDIISGEGVFGLQRGFKKAGAKTIIMSLWNVNDESTMKMMTSFYHKYLEGMSKEDAFHAAQDELRKDCSPQQERPDWAAFVLLDGLN